MDRALHGIVMRTGVGMRGLNRPAGDQQSGDQHA
jgi:hypothetical protein